MELGDVADYVRRAVRITVAGAVSAHLSILVSSVHGRVLLTASAALLVTGGQRVAPQGALPVATVAGDLVLAVASSTLVEAVGAGDGAAGCLTIAHLCMTLLVGRAVAPAVLGQGSYTFLVNTQYLAADAIAAVILSSRRAAVGLAGAAACVGLSQLGSRVDEVLCMALAQAAVSVLRALALDPLPAGLRLPTIVALLALVRPLTTLGAMGSGHGVYAFVLYQAGGALQSTLQSLLPAGAAALASLTLVAASPLPIFRAVSQIAAAGAVTAWVMAGAREVADTDPFMALLSLLVFAQVVMAGLGGKH
jgi:hypothetical protein